MAYVAVKGGEAAIQQAEKLYHALKGPVTREFVRELQDKMPYLVDRVMGEGSLYSPELAALALAQSGDDLYEAVLLADEGDTSAVGSAVFSVQRQQSGIDLNHARLLRIVCGDAWWTPRNLDVL